MKKYLVILIGLITLSCDTMHEGEVKKVSTNDSIEVFEYNYDDDRHHIFVARFKGKPVTTVNYNAQQRKTTYMQGVIIIETDSIITIRKENK